VLAGRSAGAAISPYLPLQVDPAMDRQVERVFLLAGRPLMTRPVTAAAVAEALAVACPHDPRLCRSVSRYLARYAGDIAAPEVTFSGGLVDGNGRTAAPNRHGLSGDAKWQVSAGMSWQPAPGVLLAAGGVADAGKAVPTGSLVSLGWARAQLDLGWRDHWLSPLTDSAMLLGTEARTMPSVTLSNPEPLTAFRIRYEAFAALMSESANILYGAGLTAGRPRLVGVHLSSEPAAGVAFGLNRVMQFGGGARGGNSPLDVIRAYFNPSHYDNVSDPVHEYQFGNQAVSLTSRFLFPGSVPFSVYAEYGGDDTSAGSNFLLGNASLSVGIDFPRLWQRFDLTAEVSEWQNGWYTHHVYRDGLANAGRVIGHWGADQRQAGDGAGARSAMLRLGWWLDSGDNLELRLRALENQRYAPTAPPYVHAHDIGLRYNHPAGPLTVGFELGAGRDVFGADNSRALAFIRYVPGTPGSPPMAVGDVEGGRAAGAELFMDAGLEVARLRIDLDRTQVPVVHRWTDPAVHFGLGARRRVSARQDLGMRIEHGDVGGHALTGVRALDYRYRFAGALALTGFVGAARYDLATPAYGQYLGAGLQWRGLLPRMDATLELKHAIRVARDDLVAGDYGGGRPDSFHDITALSLYLSYRF
jgi:hypothetical protein